MEKTEHIVQSEADTISLAHSLSEILIKPGRKIGINGPLGAGKTFFAKALFENILLNGEFVKSPSFTVMNEYNTKFGFSIQHLDLYRVSSELELEGTGFYDTIVDDTTVMFIEWYKNIDISSYYNNNWIFIDIDIIGDTMRKFVIREHK